jgi:hypothetical protein
MPYSLSAPAGALVWAVNEPVRLARHPRGSRRARRRGLSSTVSRVERSAEYRRSLSTLHELATRLQQGLDTPQREQWLVLEEAWLAHSERLSHVYYHAGFRCGVEWNSRSRAPRDEAARPSRLPAGARSHRSSAIGVEAEAALGAGADCLAALARLLLAVARR